MVIYKISHIFVPINSKLINKYQMIVSDLKHSERVEPLHPLFRKLFDYVKSHDLLHAEPGRIEIDGDNLFVNKVCAQGVSAEKQPLEAHREYIDVHILLEGKERIGWKSIEDVSHVSKPYEAEGDCALYAEPASVYVDLLPGQFLVVYPEDPHAPLIGEGQICKLIGKVRIDY